MEIQPLEDFVLAGLSKRVSTVFGCKTLITTANDKTRALAKLQEGNAVEYPYAFITVQSMAINRESYVNTSLSRVGVPVVLSETQAFKARITPTNFNIEIEYHTNQFKGSAQSVTGFVKRWLFACKCGYLKFNVNYGRLEARIGITMDDQVTIPSLESKVDQEAVYKITANLVVHGYTSEPILGSMGIINEIDISETYGPAQGYTYAAFPSK